MAEPIPHSAGPLMMSSPSLPGVASRSTDVRWRPLPLDPLAFDLTSRAPTVRAHRLTVTFIVVGLGTRFHALPARRDPTAARSAILDALHLMPA